MTNNDAIPRRKFLSQAGAAAALTIVPRHVLGRGFVPPSDKLNIAGVGVGGMGRANLINLSSQNIVALCDVDWGYAGKALDRLDADITKLRARIEGPPAEPTPGQPAPEFNREKAKTQLADMIQLKTDLPKAKRHKDYRQMLEQQKDIEAIVVATPDHMHATIALAAMDLGKHVYVQKPMAWSVDEARRLARRAKETKSPRKWAIKAIRWMKRARPLNMCGRAPLETCAKFTSGPTARWASGHKACPARNR